ncbi:long-chain fatty acid--CoA ligase [Sporosarcina sp. P13]|uniref:long-chain-fatty-acid--CoA ligase n=1 Tax=Sporosarcina sp. P13 TaxID=2048263 RepID=UPI000C173793|nr:long-chain fatty acid--CoA ligase [Sporosarcina sp. P13]PIC64923.1 long-chain fatty acid--CoA ligase [Sporosarcina sp. P13]
MSKRWYPFNPENVPCEIKLPEVSIYNLLEDSALKFPQHTAVIDGEKKLTYSELKKAVDHLAAALHHKGFKKGDRICVMLPNCKEYIIASYAIHRLGGVIVQVNPMYQLAELKYVFKDSEAKWLISRSEQQQKVEEIGVSDEFIMIEADDKASDKPNNMYNWIQEERDELPAHEIQSKIDIALLQYTGGTTGYPKGAMLTHFNIVSNIYQSYVAYAGVYERGGEIVLGIAPVYHAMGMMNMSVTIFSGSTYVAVEQFNINKLPHLIRNYKITTLSGSPTMYIALLRHPDIQTGDLDSLKICTCGSSPMPVEVMNEFELRSGARIVEAYGLTEATTGVCRNPMVGIRKVGSIGIPYPNTDIKVVDIETRTTEVPVGEPGELIIKGPQIMKGYWKNPEETEYTIRNEWLYTGDIATMDEDGYFYIAGRLKDLIISGGYNIYPAEIENVLYEHPAISEAVVYGVPDSYYGEVVKAAVVLKQHMITTEEEIISWCNERLAKYKYPRLIDIRDSLPKTTVGKILRRVLVEEEKEKFNAPNSNS